jgi:hypothetical protein
MKAFIPDSKYHSNKAEKDILQATALHANTINQLFRGGGAT